LKYEPLEISEVGGPLKEECLNITVTLGPFESKVLHITTAAGDLFESKVAYLYIAVAVVAHESVVSQLTHYMNCYCGPL